ncbi:hypothetical protein U1Q18_028184 [Sarracenia purpurea var. burkii]
MPRVADQGDLNKANQKEKKTDRGISNPVDREKEKSPAAQADAQEKSSTAQKLQCSRKVPLHRRRAPSLRKIFAAQEKLGSSKENSEVSSLRGSTSRPMKGKL